MLIPDWLIFCSMTLLIYSQCYALYSTIISDHIVSQVAKFVCFPFSFSLDWPLFSNGLEAIMNIQSVDTSASPLYNHNTKMILSIIQIICDKTVYQFMKHSKIF